MQHLKTSILEKEGCLEVGAHVAFKAAHLLKAQDAAALDFFLETALS